jgi:hypothetical protein
MVGAQVSPSGGDQRARAIWQHEDELKATMPMEPSQNLERLALERVALSDNRYAFGIAVEMVVVGSVSSVVSTSLRTQS